MIHRFGRRRDSCVPVAKQSEKTNGSPRVKVYDLREVGERKRERGRAVIVSSFSMGGRSDAL